MQVLYQSDFDKVLVGDANDEIVIIDAEDNE